jgi:hypothetical protein
MGIPQWVPGYVYIPNVYILKNIFMKNQTSKMPFGHSKWSVIKISILYIIGFTIIGNIDMGSTVLVSQKPGPYRVLTYLN